MELEDLVTGALAPGAEKKVAQSPAGIIENNQMIQPGALADLIDSSLADLENHPEKSWELVAEIVAYQIASSLSSAPASNALLLFHAESATQGDRESLQWLQARLQEIRETMRETEKKRRRSSAIGSFSASLDFLVSLFGESAEEEIATITGAKRPTVRKWLGGSTAQWNNSNKVMSVARVLFVLVEERGKSDEEALQWFLEPLPSGQSPQDLWASSHWSLPPELRQELEKLGIHER